MLVYKIFRDSEWQALQDDGRSKGSLLDLTDGFVHLSTAEQVRETAAKHFASHADLMLLAFEAEVLRKDLKWETSRNGALFPHLYRALELNEMKWVKPLPLVNGEHAFPDEVS